MIQIDFFDKDVVKTLVPVRTMEPDRVYFLTDKRLSSEKRVKNILKAIHSWDTERGARIQAECIWVDATDIRDIREKMIRLIQSLKDPDIYMDFTGGPELMCACGFDVCPTYGITAVYADLQREAMIDVHLLQTIRPIRHICLQDYITAIGAKRLANSHNMPKPSEYKAICEMAELIFAHVDAWQELYQYLSGYAKSNLGAMTATLHTANHRFHHWQEIRELIDAFERLGFWKKTEETGRHWASLREGSIPAGQRDAFQSAETDDSDNDDRREMLEASGLIKPGEPIAESIRWDDSDDFADSDDADDTENTDGLTAQEIVDEALRDLFAVSDAGGIQYRYKNQKFKSYLTTFGIWLELYIYIKVQECSDEACLGVVIDWDGGDDLDTEDNEIDVLMLKKSIPTFISCKMRKPVASDVYEVGYLARRLGGGTSRAIVATTWPVSRTHESPRGIYQRLEKMRVGLVETDSFADRSTADIFNRARQMTE